ncbi:hypothetical protein ACGFXB_03175 [Streptomyces canus]|uniref:hypothetical protein n=1 Tax=Streptomyces canus TaxID=58343 RepID=UPI003717D15B
MADSDGQIDYDYTEMNMCFNEKHTTNFAGGKNMDEMKAMLGNARPDLVTDVAKGWSGLATHLTDIQAEFEKEVARIQAHWTGAAADGFAAKAKQVSRSIGNTAKYASHTSIAMTNVGASLGPIKDEVMAMEKPGRVSSFLNSAGDGFTRSGEGTDKDIAAGKGAQEVLDRNHDDLSAGREAQLKMASKMETLGAAYNSQTKAMGSWNKVREDHHEYPPEPGGIAPTPVVVPTGTTRSPQRATTSRAHGSQVSPISSSKAVTPPSGITGGAHKSTPSQPQVGTAIDGVPGGRTGAPSTGGGAGAVGGATAGATGIGGGAGFVGGAVGGAAGSGAARGIAGRAGAAGATGRAAGGVGGAGKSGAGRVGGSARGGVVGGTPKAGAGAGRGTAGGSGLHSSRGAAGEGAGAVRKGGIAGAPGSRAGRRKGDEQRERERPDYLVEDEETWTPQTNAAPRVIE